MAKDLFDEFGVDEAAQPQGKQETTGDLFDEFGVETENGGGASFSDQLNARASEFAQSDEGKRFAEEGPQGSGVFRGFGAGAAQGTLGLSESIFRTPDAVRRWSRGTSESVEEITGLPRMLNPVRAVESTADFFASGQVPGTNIRTGGGNEIAAGISEAQGILSEEVDAFKALANSSEKADKALKDALMPDEEWIESQIKAEREFQGKDFDEEKARKRLASYDRDRYSGLLDVVSDPEVIAGFVGQAAPSLVTSYVSGGSIPFIAWMESMEVASGAEDFERRTGQKISDKDFMQAQAQVAVVNSMLEKIGLDKVLAAKPGRLFSSMLKAGGTEATTELAQNTNTNAAVKFAYDPDKSLTEGAVQSAVGGFGAGVGGGGVVGMSRSENSEGDLFDELTPDIASKEQYTPDDTKLLRRANEQTGAPEQQSEPDTDSTQTQQTDALANEVSLIPGETYQINTEDYTGPATIVAPTQNPNIVRVRLEGGTETEAGVDLLQRQESPDSDSQQQYDAISDPITNVQPVQTAERTSQNTPTTRDNSLGDPRIGRLQYRGALRQMAKELVKGGDVSYVRDQNGVITGRTPSVNPEWFKSMNQDPDLSMSTDQVKSAVNKSLAGERLGVRERRVVGAMLDIITGEREASVDYARRELEVARKNRRAMRAGFPPIDAYNDYIDNAGEVFDEYIYDAEWTADNRSIYELSAVAIQADEDRASSIIEQLSKKQITENEAAQHLWAIIGETHGQQTEKPVSGDAGTVEARESGGQVAAAEKAQTEDQVGAPSVQAAQDRAPSGRAGEGNAPVTTPSQQVPQDAAPAPEPAPAEQSVSPAAQGQSTPVTIEPFGEKRIIIKGNKDTIRAKLEENGLPKGMWNAKQEGVVLPKQHEAEAGKALTGDRRTHQEPVSDDQRHGERRHAVAVRHAVEELTTDEMKEVIKYLRQERITNPMTGMPNKVAFDEDASLGWDHEAALDMDGLGFYNDVIGHVFTDELIKEIGRVIGSKSGEQVRFYHRSGDEFAGRGVTAPELNQQIKAAENDLIDVTFKGVAIDAAGSEYEIIVKGLGITGAIGGSYDQADANVGAIKERKTAEGRRAEKGTNPGGITVIARSSGAAVDLNDRGISKEEAKSRMAEIGWDFGEQDDNGAEASSSGAATTPEGEARQPSVRQGADKRADTEGAGSAVTDPTETPASAGVSASGAVKESLTSADEKKATAILDRANVTGKDRLDVMRDFRDGKYSLEDLEKAYPVSETAKESDTTPEVVSKADDQQAGIIEKTPKKPKRKSQQKPPEPEQSNKEKAIQEFNDIADDFAENEETYIENDEFLEEKLSASAEKYGYSVVSRSGLDQYGYAGIGGVKRDDVALPDDQSALEEALNDSELDVVRYFDDEYLLVDSKAFARKVRELIDIELEQHKERKANEDALQRAVEDILNKIDGTEVNEGSYGYLNVEYGEEVYEVRAKDHRSAVGGGFNQGTGERYGDAGVDVYFDDDGKIIVNNILGEDTEISRALEELSGKNVSDLKSGLGKPNKKPSAPKYSSETPESTTEQEKPITQKPQSGGSLGGTAPQNQSTPDSANQQPINDFGEKIGGARKDVWQRYAEDMREVTRQDIIDKPLSKIWPEPNYQKLIEDGADPAVVATVRAMRDEVPNKPRSGWKLGGWVKQVEVLHGLVTEMMSNPGIARSVMEKMDGNRVMESVTGRAELYQVVGHDKSLKGVTMTNDFLNHYHGEENVTKWFITRQAKATAFSNMPRELAVGDSKQEAIDKFKAAIAAGKVDKPASKQVRFEIGTYTDGPNAGKTVIYKKIGREKVPLESFDSVKEARAYLAENEDKLVEKLERFKQIPNHRKETNSPRVGADHRNGADVTPEQFQEAFGFRGVEFGNYVEQRRRQADLNRAYDALMDLAGVLNIPSRAMSLNGELGLAFGARGKGGKNAPAAHYEHGRIVINLTKREGAGSLAHEWFHSMDNYFSRMRGRKNDYLTEDTGINRDGVRQEVIDAFRNVARTINRTSLKQRSANLDRTRTKPYWQTGLEMHARAFESYVIEKLKDANVSNDYLANIVSQEYWDAAAKLGLEKDNSYPYPEAAEIPAIREAFDNLFEVIETKETDKGTALFAFAGKKSVTTDLGALEEAKPRNNGADINKDDIFRSGTTPANSMSVAGVEKAVADVILTWGDNAPAVKVVKAESDLPAHIRQQIDAFEDNTGVVTKGVLDPATRTVYLVAEGLESKRDALTILAHEAVGHYGMEEMLGPDQFQQLVKRVQWMKKAGNKKVRALADQVAEFYGNVDPTTEAKEVIALMAEQQQMQSVFGKTMKGIRQAVRQFLRKLGFKVMFSASDIDAMLSRAGKYLRQSGGKSRQIGGVLHHKNLGEIAVEMGKDGQYGAGKFASENPEIAANLAAEVAGAKLVQESDTRATLQSEDATFHLIKEGGRWVLTGVDSASFARKKAPDGGAVTAEDIDSNIKPPKAQRESTTTAYIGTDENGKPVTVQTAAPSLKEQNALKYWAKRLFTKEGQLTEDAFERHIETHGIKNEDEVEAQFLVADLMQNVKKAYGKRYSKLTDAQREAMNAYLAGKDAEVPDGVKPSLDAMRGVLDNLSVRTQRMLMDEVKYALEARSLEERRKASTLVGEAVKAHKQGDLEAMDDSLDELEAISSRAAKKVRTFLTIEGNKGEYLNRSYRVFDDKNWHKKVSPEVVESAREYLTDRIRNDKRYEDLGDKEIGDHVDGVINSILRTDKADMLSFMSGGQLGQKDLSVLKRRKEIAPEIRALMGENKDPRVNFTRSLGKMSYLVANHHFLKHVREDGLGNYLSTKPSGRMTQEITAFDESTMSPLAGLYATPEFAEAIQNAVTPRVSEGWLRQYLRLNTAVKYGKTVLSPTTMFRNFYSALMFTVMNGHFNYSSLIKATAHTWADLGPSKLKRLGYIRKLVRLGVLHDNPHAGELREALDEVADMDTMSGSMPARAVKTVLNAATKAYRAGDDFWKIIGFENERKGLMDAGMSEVKAEKEAARRVRDGYPTYSMVPETIRMLRRFPLVGTFVSFPWEMIRTTKNQFVMLKDDFQAGRSAMAAKRAVGMTIAGGLSAGISQVTMALLGIDDDDDEAIRQLAAPWQRNAQIAYLGYDEDGNLRYLDLSHLDPYTYVKIPFTVMANGSYDSADEKVVAMLQESLAPFLGTEIAAGALLEVWSNKKQNGGPVYNEYAPTWTQGRQAFNHLRKSLQPGLFSNVERTLKAANNRMTSYGKQYSMEDEALAWVGFRLTTADPSMALRFRAFDFNDHKNAAGKPVYRILRSPNASDTDEVGDAVEQAKVIWNEAFKDMHATVRAARVQGLSDEEIGKSLQNGGIPTKYIGYIIQGKTPPWTPSNQSIANAVKAATQGKSPLTEAQFKKRMQALDKALKTGAEGGE